MSLPPSPLCLSMSIFHHLLYFYPHQSSFTPFYFFLHQSLTTPSISFLRQSSTIPSIPLLHQSSTPPPLFLPMLIFHHPLYFFLMSIFHHILLFLFISTFAPSVFLFQLCISILACTFNPLSPVSPLPLHNSAPVSYNLPVTLT